MEGKRLMRYRRLGIVALITGSLAFVAPTVTAQDDPGLGDDEGQTFDFEEDEISTDYLKPNTMTVEGLSRGRMSSLISIRLNFIDEIMKSAEDI